MVVISSKESEKKTQGRRKIEIKPLAESSRQQVTFSKRRVGLFKKAGELAILCDSQVAVIAFSPGKKPFFFGHPSPEAVISRFVDDQEPSGSDHGAESALPENLDEINKQYEEAGKELEMEKRRGKGLAESESGEFWWEKAAPECMGVEELEYYTAALQDLKMNVEKKLDDVVNVKPTGDPRGHVGVLNRFAHQARDVGLGLGLPTDSLLNSGFGPFISGHGHGNA